MGFHVIIPARYHSTRLAAKALALIGEQPMIVHVCQQALKSGAQSITVATDHDEIIEQVERAGFNAVLTRDDHQSGSDRVYEAAQLAGLAEQDIIVNVQGDEPFIPAENIQQVASLLTKTSHSMATLCCPISSAADVLDANIVKVVFDQNLKALYFSRAPIPFCRDNPLKVSAALPTSYYRHIGIYAYRKSFLQKFIGWSPSSLELTESLEQLRAMENGASIAIHVLSDMPPAGVDTLEDLQKAQAFYLKQQNI
ncbi:3-deoxy-manno-octulosonate cytidylyltransferase [Aliikangiella maris]|uniref:3-deoxy-manno-octulosonate cytidylyltransferase n=2 Tax=Aliikangiella maris TaxID=3162458 RepID=A0ABV2BU59_9GAMM